MIDVLGYDEQEANDEVNIYSLNELFTPEQLEDCKKYNTPAEITSRADEDATQTIKLYHHKTDGGAEYLTDKYVKCLNGHKEGTFKDTKYIVKIDGDITKDVELTIKKCSESREKG